MNAVIRVVISFARIGYHIFPTFVQLAVEISPIVRIVVTEALLPALHSKIGKVQRGESTFEKLFWIKIHKSGLLVDRL